MTEFSEVLVNGRWPVAMPPHRAARPWWQWWEKERLTAMRAAVRPGDVVVDVGAEQGDLPALWGTWGAEVVMVEPAAEAWPCIRGTWEANVPDRPPLACFAGFADQDGPGLSEVTQQAWPAAAACEWVDEPGFRHSYEGGDIPRVALDDLAATLGRPIDAVTIDVEGAEFRVLRGALGVLSEQRPTVLLSLHGHFLWDRYGEMTDDLLIWLHKVAGYETHFLAYDHEQHVLCSPRA